MLLNEGKWNGDGGEWPDCLLESSIIQALPSLFDCSKVIHRRVLALRLLSAL